MHTLVSTSKSCCPIYSSIIRSKPLLRTFAMTIKSAAESPYKSKVTGIRPLDSGKWIQLRKLEYVDPKGAERTWEMAIRTTRGEPQLEPGNEAEEVVDGVAIVTILKAPGQPDQLVLTKQFRPPVGKVVIELPAGLLDPGETVATTAVRELKEETGYVGTFIRQLRVMYSDPGLTNANMRLAFVHVDLTDPANKNPSADLQEGEFIETFCVSIPTILQELDLIMDKEGCTIDARLHHFAMGLLMS